MNRKEIPETVIHSVAVFTKKLEHCHPVVPAQMPMFSKDRRGRRAGEVHGLQHLIVESFGVNLQEMHLLNVILAENIIQSSNRNTLLDDEWSECPVQMFQDMVLVERSELIEPTRKIGNRPRGRGVHEVEDGLATCRSNCHLLQLKSPGIAEVFSQRLKARGHRLNQQSLPSFIGQKDVGD